MLDARVRAVVDRLPPDEIGRFLFSITAPQTDCEVLELPARSTVWIAAGVRYFGGRVLALDPQPDAMRAHLDDAGLGDWALVTDRHVREIDDVFDLVVLHEPADAERWSLVRERVEPGALIVAQEPVDDPDVEWTRVERTGSAGLALGVVLR
jgi:hypothetical protein